MKTKRIIIAVLLAALLTALTGSVASASENGVIRTPTSTGTVWLRSGPGTGYSRLGYTENGDLCTILATRGNWYRVLMKSGRMRGSYGWTYKKYVVNLRDSSKLSGWGTLAQIKTRYESSGVNLRKGPGTKYQSKGLLYRGDILIVLDKYNSKWYEVQVAYSDDYGYVYSTYITNGVEGYARANVNLRRAASTSSAIRLVIPQYATIKVLNVGKNWSRVNYQGYVGYVYNEYISLSS
ncbi:MAG: SH3 domain-containing protein [Clostridia bacterium]|nr:SH3 domain-containing protein [Clostridia bacterium]